MALREAFGVRAAHRYNRAMRTAEGTEIPNAAAHYERAEEVALAEVLRVSRDPHAVAKTLLGIPLKGSEKEREWSMKAQVAGAKAEEARRGRRFRAGPAGAGMLRG